MIREKPSTYILVDITVGTLGHVIDHVEIEAADPQPADSARRHFERRGIDPETQRIFIMLGNEPEWKP